MDGYLIKRRWRHRDGLGVAWVSDGGGVGWVDGYLIKRRSRPWLGGCLLDQVTGRGRRGVSVGAGPDGRVELAATLGSAHHASVKKQLYSVALPIIWLPAITSGTTMLPTSGGMGSCSG